MLILFASAILPVLIILFAIYRADKINKEPIGKLILVFICGALIAFPAALLESVLDWFEPSGALLGGLYKGFCVAAFSEELLKLLVLFLLVWNSRHFDEYFDGIVYAVYVSMGFACVENILYVFSSDDYGSSLATAAMRAILSVPGHFLFAVMMGYYLGLAKFSTNRRGRYLLYAFLVPVFFHGTFDALLMIPEGMDEGGLKWLVTLALFIVFILFDIKMWRRGIRRIRHLQQLSSDQNADKIRNEFEGFQWNF